MWGVFVGVLVRNTSTQENIVSEVPWVKMLVCIVELLYDVKSIFEVG